MVDEKSNILHDETVSCLAITVLMALHLQLTLCTLRDHAALFHRHKPFRKYVPYGVCTHILVSMGNMVCSHIREVYEQNYDPRSPIRWHYEDVFMHETPRQHLHHWDWAQHLARAASSWPARILPKGDLLCDIDDGSSEKRIQSWPLKSEQLSR